MSSSLYQARRLTLIVLVLLMGALFISCNNNSDEEVIVGQAQLNSDTSGLINDVNRLQNSIAKGELLRSTADKERGQIVKLLNDIKIDEALLNIGVSKIDNENTTKYKKMSTNNLFINWQKNIKNVDVNVGARYIKHNKFGNKTVYNWLKTKMAKN